MNKDLAKLTDARLLELLEQSDRLPAAQAQKQRPPLIQEARRRGWKVTQNQPAKSSKPSTPITVEGLGERSAALAPLSRNHASTLLRWRNRRDPEGWAGSFQPTGDVELSRRWIEGQSNDPRYYTFLVLERASSTAIGLCWLHLQPGINRSAELSIAIYENHYLGKGIGSGAVAQLLRLAFLELNLERVWLTVRPDNERARKAFQKCGFVEEGRARKAMFSAGRFHDLLLMSVLREEFLEREGDGGSG